MLYHTTLNGEKKKVEIENAGVGRYRMRIDERSFDVDCRFLSDGLYLSLLIDSASYTVETRRAKRPGVWVTRFGGDYLDVTVRDDLEERAAARREEEVAGGPAVLMSPMPGVVVKLSVSEGDLVEEGETVAVVEAMKMQNELGAPRSGRVASIVVTVGEALETRSPIATIEPVEEGE